MNTIEDFFEEEETPIDNYANAATYELSFNLTPIDIQIIDELSKKKNIPYSLAVKDVIRDALDLYHKFIKIMND